jgi:hypothetical protein
MPKTITMTALAALFAAAPLGAAFADRAPSADETAMISDVLLSEGYTSWGKIELDDNQWEVENAIDQDGNRRDIVLDSGFYVLSSDEDDGDSVVQLGVN